MSTQQYLLTLKALIVILVTQEIIYSSETIENTGWTNYTHPYYYYDIEETDNHIWLATGGGLVKINKTDDNVEILKKTNSFLNCNSIGTLCKDTADNLWAGSYSTKDNGEGIYKYNGDSLYNDNMDNSCIFVFINSINHSIIKGYRDL